MTNLPLARPGRPNVIKLHGSPPMHHLVDCTSLHQPPAAFQAINMMQSLCALFVESDGKLLRCLSAAGNEVAARMATSDRSLRRGSAALLDRVAPRILIYRQAIPPFIGRIGLATGR
ncbi:hypothetical protein [Rhizobium sp.]|uniref:hypothetical protein n=1 Tax=Rhizobium sp. TaxID=391 RepID=UPI0013AEBFC6